MTAELTVPAAVWACRQPGVPLVAAIVEGERYEAMVRWLTDKKSWEPGPAFLGMPERWLDDPHFRCENGHVSTRILKSEERGDICLAAGCGGRCRLTFPEDTETDPPTPIVAPPWLVALRDARCECVDAGTPGWIGPPEDLTPCPRCVDGRLLHDVRVETAVSVMPPEWWSDGHKGPRTLPTRTEVRTVRCLVDVVEVVDPDTAGREPQRPAVVVYDESGRRAYYERQRTPQYGDVRLTHVDALAAACGKPPADWPGGYAVILTTTDQEAE